MARREQFRLLLCNFGAIEYEKYANYLLPKTPWDISFQETIFLLKDFGEGVHFQHTLAMS